MSPSPPILEAKSLGKRYGATIALDDVSFSLMPGEVCGLLGENGAGKSTLVKVLSGVVTPDSGEIRIDGDLYVPRDILDARARGVSTAFQELSLIPTLSVATNLFLPKPASNAIGLVSRRQVEAEAAAVMQEYGIGNVQPGALIGDLSLGLRQRIEIVRAMLRKPRVLLLDEPTAALSDREWLFELIGRFVARGAAILYISHKLDEIRRLCKRCVILRNGTKVLDSEVGAMSDEAVFSNMAGRSVVEAYPPYKSGVRVTGAAALQVHKASAEGVSGVSFDIRPGEILGVAGLEGQGQSSLFKMLVGLNPLLSGRLEIGGAPRVIKSPRAARAAGMVLVPEERKSEGIFADLSTVANISLPNINQAGRFNLLSGAKERRMVEEPAARVDLSDRNLALNVDALSGGNQQKAVLARALLVNPKCLLLFDPTRGVDVGTKFNIYRVIQEFVQDGGAVLFYSTELDELVHLCDRCIVIYQYTIAAEVPRERLSQELLLSLAAGRGPAATVRHGAAPQPA
jgi:ribose transport system ATP-binding protein